MRQSYSDSEYESTPSPAWMAHIPAPVRYHSDLPPAAKLFYAEITALTRREGFCWATNDYFMSLYNVSRATVKNWLQALSKAGFIRVELSADRQSRKIYLREVFPSENVAKKLATGGEKISYGGQKNWLQTEEKEIKKTEIRKNVRTTPRPLQGRGSKQAGETAATEPVSGPKTEGKVSASPPTVEAASPLADRVEAAISLTGDTGSRARFRQIWQIVKKNHKEAEWDAAYNATKTALEGRTAPKRPGAYFHAILVNSLREKGVTVPTGSRQEQEEIRRIIRESLAAADTSAA